MADEACGGDGDRIEGIDDDIISSLPDEILEYILSFIPTKVGIRTSVLSKRWRHVWSKTPSLYFDSVVPTDIRETLTYYKAPKISSFHIDNLANASQIDSWIEFAVSHKAEKLSFMFNYNDNTKQYIIPESFYVNSSLKQLEFKMCFFHMIPRGLVIWKSLKNLSLEGCRFCNESFHKILSGCPVLESLELQLCDLPEHFDLSKSPLRLRRLVINACNWYHDQWKFVIVAPKLHSLTLRNSRSTCSLVDVSSLTEATLDNMYALDKPFTTDFLQDMLKMLEKLQNVKKLTIGEVFLQILSLAELCGLPFPTFKVKSLTLKSMVGQSTVPGIKRLLQNSDELKKLTLHRMGYCSSLPEVDLDCYLNSQGLNPDQCKDKTFPMFWGKDDSPKLMPLFVELVLKNTKTLETIIVCAEKNLGETRFEELHQLASTLSHSNNVSIVILK